MNKRNYTSIKKVINDVMIKSGNKTEINPEDVLYLANGIASLLLPGDSFVEKMAIIDIDNYKGQLPSNFKYMSQAVYNKELEEDKIISRITEGTKKIYGTDCSLTVALNCDTCGTDCRTKVITMDMDYNDVGSHPEWAYNHSKFFYGARNMNNYKHTHGTGVFEGFTLMRRTSNYFFNIPYHINECINLNADSTVEYNIENNNIIVNFKKGKVIIAYVGVELDEDGYRMIPDLEEVYEAIYYSIRERLAENRFDAEPNQVTSQALQRLEIKASQKRKVAKSILSEMEPDEWEMFIRNHWVRTIPQHKWERSNNRFVGDKTYTRNHTLGKN